MRVLNSYESTIKKGDTMTYPEACGILGIPYYADIDSIKKHTAAFVSNTIRMRTKIPRQ